MGEAAYDGADAPVDEPVEAPDDAARLRAAVLALKAPQAAKRAPAPRSSVYGRAAAAVPSDVRQAASAAVLAARLRSVETSALLPGTALTLVVSPRPRRLPAETERCCELLTGAGATVVVLGVDLPRRVSDRSAPLSVPLRADDSLRDEWAMVACGPHRRVAFLARRRSDDVWDWLITRDPVAVHRAGTALLERVPFLRLRVPVLA
ncbi:MAG TPA: hypothetical protein VNU26_13025 [Mycobacteriales bacterium]|nr:hypothetical protein [Mycobacteriales bacterium]